MKKLLTQFLLIWLVAFAFASEPLRLVNAQPAPVIINPYQYASLDADATLFITTCGITDATQKAAINTLVVSMKSAGVWTKMRTVYPFVGGTAATHKCNLKNPADADAAFRLVFTGGWTHSALGAQSNGTNATANTFFNPSAQYASNAVSLGVYFKNYTFVSGRYAMGAHDGNFYAVGGMTASNQLRAFINDNGGGNVSFGGLATAEEFFQASSDGSVGTNAVGTHNSTAATFAVTHTTRPNRNFIIGGLNTGSPGNFFNARFIFAYMGDSLTQAEMLAYNTAVQTFQTTLSR